LSNDSSAHSSSQMLAAPPHDGWHVLIVDDEPDVHSATRLAVKRKTWQKRPFVLRDVSSSKEAQDLLRDGEYRNQLQVAVVDVVMETDFAGLDLCRFIRAELPRSVRIILRTGQPGVAPEERIIEEYDIDFYFAKTEATADRLYMALRTCLRSSLDIETVLAFGNQLRSFTTALQKMTSREDLTRFMRVGLDFLELKHSAEVVFVSDVDSKDDEAATTKEARIVASAFAKKVDCGKLHKASDIGVDAPGFVLLFNTTVEGSRSRRGGFVVQAPALSVHGLQNDLVSFVQNWAAALAGLLAQTRVADVGALTELTYLDRIGGIATVLIGAGRRIEHAVNAAELTTKKLKAIGNDVEGAEGKRVADLYRGGIASLEQDLATAKNIIGSYGQVSRTQLRDVRMSINLVDFARDCVSLITRPDCVTINVSCTKSALPWLGYPGSLAHVLVKLLQGAIRHAYGDQEAGTIDVRLFEEEKGYRLEVEDYGKGEIPAEVLSRLAAPADPSVPAMVGLKVAVAHNIVSHRLFGRMTCTSEEGVGTKFEIFLPREVPEVT
jgi:signal transduction histidine kinase